jgi:hypothetical protein
MYQELYDSTHIIVTIGSQALPALSRVPFCLVFGSSPV